MKWVLSVVLLMVLAGCSAAPTWETVEDISLPEIVQPAAYEIQMALPDGAELLWETDSGKQYQLNHMEIESIRYYASDLDAAVEYVSGFAADRLDILETSRFGMPEYRFAWCSQTEEGARLYRADLVMDGSTCYALICSAPEDAGEFHDQARQVFSSFGLSMLEVV